MSAHDLFHGTVTLPDGRQCNGKLWGVNHPDGFEMRNDDPLEIEWMDGTPLSDAEYDEVAEFVEDWLSEHGKFERWEPDYD